MERTWDFNFRGLVRAFRGPSRGAVTCPSPVRRTVALRTNRPARNRRRGEASATCSERRLVPGMGAAGAPQPREGALAPAGPTPGGPASPSGTGRRGPRGGSRPRDRHPLRGCRSPCQHRGTSPPLARPAALGPVTFPTPSVCIVASAFLTLRAGNSVLRGGPRAL